MGSAPKNARPEQERTDASLGRERAKTDRELAERRVDAEKEADRVLERAQTRADEVLTRARERADDNLRKRGATAQERSVVAAERQQADLRLELERATAADALSAERLEERRIRLSLLALERGETDRDLLLEREGADKAIRSRDDFLAMASHDLRNILGGIAMSAASLNNIRCDEDVGTAIVRDADRIQRYVGRMARLVGDLVDVVSLDAGQLALVPHRRDAVELLRETLEVFQPIAAAKNIRIGTEVKAGSLLARYDHERILQVLANLVGNALKFTPEGGRVHILVEPVGGEIRFAVSDTGAGIAPEKLDVIFERFWQVADQKTRSGLGLGLYIARCIVEAHGGRIWAESQAGEGSTFYFTLPSANGASVRDLSAH